MARRVTATRRLLTGGLQTASSTRVALAILATLCLLRSKFRRFVEHGWAYGDVLRHSSMRRHFLLSPQRTNGSVTKSVLIDAHVDVLAVADTRPAEERGCHETPRAVRRPDRRRRRDRRSAASGPRRAAREPMRVGGDERARQACRSAPNDAASEAERSGGIRVASRYISNVATHRLLSKSRATRFGASLRTASLSSSISGCRPSASATSIVQAVDVTARKYK